MDAKSWKKPFSDFIWNAINTRKKSKFTPNSPAELFVFFEKIWIVFSGNRPKFSWVLMKNYAKRNAILRKLAEVAWWHTECWKSLEFITWAKKTERKVWIWFLLCSLLLFVKINCNFQSVLSCRSCNVKI